MRRLADGLWIHECPLRFYGLEIGRRMVVAELGDGGLWVNAPAPLDGDLRRELDRLGEVRFVLPSSTFHGHISMGDYADAYPDAELFSMPGLERKRPDLPFTAELGRQPDARWASHIDQTFFEGTARPIEREAEFFHSSSGTLILADLALSFGPTWPPATRAYARLAGMRDRLKVGAEFRFRVRDREAVEASLGRILAWDFDRVVTGHGDMVESGGQAAFQRGVADVLSG